MSKPLLRDDSWDTFPISRLDWAVKAHAPDVLSFQVHKQSFKKLPRGSWRSTFASLASHMMDLGKGATVRVVGGKPESHPSRAVAYCDAICMGESANTRGSFWSASDDASSCGMFVRNLYKMIGVRAPSYAAPYNWGDAIAKEHEFAQSIGAVRKPGIKKTVDGTEKLLVPTVGDVIYMANGSGHQHTFVVGTWRGAVMKRTQDLREHERGTLTYRTLQGGAGSAAEFPGDGSCMATRAGTIEYSIDHDDHSRWSHKDLTVRYWIDLETLVSKGLDGGPYVAPLRVARY